MNPINSNWRKKIQKFFIPLPEGSVENYIELMPMLAMVTLVMVGLYIMNIRVSTLAHDLLRLTAFTVLFFIHLLLYWMILNFIQSERRVLYYLIAQGTLAFVLVLISGNIYLAIGLYSAVSGTSVGMLGRGRLAFASVLSYIFLATLSILLLSDFDVLLDLSPVIIGAVSFSAFFAYMFQRLAVANERTHVLLQDLKTAHAQLAEYALEVENLTLTAERQRMARELHDTLSQGLAGLILQLEAADSHLDRGRAEKAHGIVRQSMSRARITLTDARGAIDNLRATQNPADLGQAVQEEIERFTASTNIHCSLELCELDTLSPQTAENALRAISEGLTNIARHAAASHVDVALTCDKQHLDILIRDNGVGFNPEEALGRAGHYGLLGLRERARLSGGSLTIESAPARGATLTIKLPLRDSHE